MSTKVVAMDMPMADSSLLDTPINGHKPRNLTNTKLFTNTVPINSKKYSTIMLFIVFLMAHIIRVYLPINNHI
ncbi:MAG: hypothetical protein ACPG8A_14690, partial [Psychrobium sp.]